MQKQDFALYVPIDASRVQWCFLNRLEAFRSRFESESDVLIGYKRYEDAVKAGRARFANESCFAVLSVSFNEHVRNALSMGQLLDGESQEEKTAAPIWRVFSKGAELLANPSNAAMWAQIVETKPSETADKGGSGSAGKPTKIEAAGPTGFGC